VTTKIRRIRRGSPIGYGIRIAKQILTNMYQVTAPPSEPYHSTMSRVPSDAIQLRWRATCLRHLRAREGTVTMLAAIPTAKETGKR
jgi:hypothetical protein